MWVKNNWVKKFGSNFFLREQKLGRKFVLAKLYFGLIRFVCVMLLLTADLNNNNTEFDLVGVFQPIMRSNLLLLGYV